MTDPVPVSVLRAVRSASTADIVHDPGTDVSELRRASTGELEVLDLLRLPHPRAYVRLTRGDWDAVDHIAAALAVARCHEEGAGA
jgi:hypothetical protein